MSKTPKESIHLYFDSVKRDHLDGRSLSRKSAEILALRDKLVTLPQAKFEEVMKLINALVGDTTSHADKETREQEQRAEAMDLYQQSQQGHATMDVDQVKAV